jgi:peptidyl-prolyl cis-trans isomerase D
MAANTMKAIFAANATKVPAYVGVTEPTGAYSIYRIDRVFNDAESPKSTAQDASRGTQLTRQVGELEFSSYLEGLKKRYKVSLAKNATSTPDSPAASSASP